MELFLVFIRFVRVGVVFVWSAPGCGVPHSDEPEKTMKEELWVGVTLSGRIPMKRIPMKRDPEGYEAKGRRLHTKPDETQTPNSATPSLINQATYDLRAEGINK